MAQSTETLHARGGLRVVPDHAFADAPRIDLLVVPGGFGTRPLLEDHATLDWIRETARGARQVTSVCTGSLLLATVDPTVTVERNERVVTDGIVTSAGVAAGIDMAFAVVEDFFGRDVADETARYIEYPRHR